MGPFHLNPSQDMMRVLLALSPLLLGVSRADEFLNNLLPDVDFDHEDCKGDTCFPTNQLLHLDRVKTGKLTYNERSVAYASTQNILAACLPGVAKEAVAESFLSCKDKKMEEICTFAKRGWLKKDSKEETVANLDFLTTSFSGLKGGAEAVKKCMKVKEEAESLDDYYYYDYDYYFDEYDYMEEGEGIEVRRKREAGKEGQKQRKQQRKRNRKNRKNTRTSKKGGKKNQKQKNSNNKSRGKKRNNNNKGKGGKRNSNNPGKPQKNKGKNKKKGKNNGKKPGNERKFVNKKPDKEPSKENEEKIKNRLAKLGLTKMPTPSTMSGLECLWDELEDLLLACAENIASTNP